MCKNSKIKLKNLFYDLKKNKNIYLSEYFTNKNMKFKMFSKYFFLLMILNSFSLKIIVIEKSGRVTHLMESK